MSIDANILDEIPVWTQIKETPVLRPRTKDELIKWFNSKNYDNTNSKVDKVFDMDINNYSFDIILYD